MPGRPTLPTKSPRKMVGTTGRRRSAGGSGSASTSRAGSTSGEGAPSVAGVSANIKVAVRVRPENEREQAGAFSNVINVVDEKMLLFDPNEEEDPFFYHGKKQGRRDLNKRVRKNQKFAFDVVYNQASTNHQVFEGTTKDLVETVISGYNCSVFAYGATGAGKTFTMLGSKDCPGITFLTMQEIYSQIANLKTKTCEIGISYLEVYNEMVRDLLCPGAQLQVRETGSNTSIPGLSIHKPTGPDHILSLLSFGNGNRTQHATDANSESSRSHAVLQVFLKMKDKDAGLSAEVRVAKMSLIDLAGSEKGGVTGNKGARFREGSNINKSLLALGNCINALADGSKYIPYRNSKLTRLLKDSIGGNCKTVMIANVSPSSETFEDTFNTLKYADRAKKIKINLKKNVVNVDFHVAQYAKIVEDLKGEITALKERIHQLESENNNLKTGGVATNVMEVDSTIADSNDDSGTLQNESRNEVEFDMLKKKLERYIERQKDYDDIQARVNEFALKIKEQDTVIVKLQSDKDEGKLGRKTDERSTNLENLVSKYKDLVEKLSNEQSMIANLKMRIHFKKQVNERNTMMTIGQSDKEKTESKTANTVHSLEKKVERKEVRKNQLKEEFNRCREDVFTAMIGLSELQTKNAKLEIQLVESQAEARHVQGILSDLGSKFETQDANLNSVLKVLRKNQVCLRGHDKATQSDQQEYEDLRGKVLEHKLTWGANQYSDAEPEIQAVEIYSELSVLDLPSLQHRSERPRSVEQKALFEDTIVSRRLSSPPPPSDQPSFHQPFANLTEQEELLPATPKLARPAARLVRRETDKSFVQTESPVTPKRDAMEEVGGPSKKPRVWEEHRESVAVPVTPETEPRYSRSLDDILASQPNDPEVETEASTSLNDETITLESQLESVAVTSSSTSLNSTFAVNVEPMDVDLTSGARQLPSIAIPDMSVIHPPDNVRKPALSLAAAQSPIQAGVATPETGPVRPRRSPRADSAMRPPAPRPSKLSSAKKYRTPVKGAGSPAKQSRRLKHSASTSVLPRAGQPSNQPLSFRTTLARVNPDAEFERSGRARGGSTGALGTFEKKKPAVGFGSSIPKENSKLSVGSKIGNGLNKMKRTVSSNVLKSSNK